MTELKNGLMAIPDIHVLCANEDGYGSVSFVMNSVHAHDIATILDEQGVAVRAGHHCAMPLMKELGLAATVRASVGVYTTKEDIQKCLNALKKVNDIFKVG